MSRSYVVLSANLTVEAFLMSIYTMRFWLIGLWFNVPVNNLSVMLGRSHRFLGIYQYFGEVKVSC